MRQRIGSALAVMGISIIAATTLIAPISQAADQVVIADGFTNQGYGGGMGDWSGPWRESPVHNGSRNGNITITDDLSGCSSGCLSIGDAVVLLDSSISRAADTSDASSLWLDIQYRIDGSPLDLAVVTLSVSGGSGSQVLRTFPLSESQGSMRGAGFDVSSHIGSETAIRFSLIGTGLEGSALLVDAVTLTATYDDEPTTTTTTTTVPTTTPTSSTTTTTTPPTTTTLPATTTTQPATTATQPATTTTTSATPPTQGSGDGDLQPQDPPNAGDLATDKVTLVASSEEAATEVMMPMAEMTAMNEPDPLYVVGFVNAAEAVRSTALYGLGIGVLLTGFLLAGFESAGREDHTPFAADDDGTDSE